MTNEIIHTRVECKGCDTIILEFESADFSALEHVVEEHLKVTK